MNAYVLDLGRELGQRGIEVDCFTRLQDEEESSLTEVGPKMRVVSLPAGPPRPLPPSSLLPYLEEFQVFVDAFRRREGLDYDLLHAHYYLSGWIALRLKALWRVPLLFMFHTIGPLKDAASREGGEREPTWRRQLEEEVARGADLIIASNPHERDSLERLYGAPEERISVVTCGVDIGLFRPLNRQQARSKLGLPPGKILLFVGRLEHIKGVDLLLQAMVFLRSVSDLPAELFPRLIMVGGEEEIEPGRAQARKLGVAPWVLFLGAQPRERMPLYYAACDVVVIPSRYESFGIVALEAAACGRPVIATSVGGLPYAVSPDRTALLVPGNEVAALALAIQQILVDQDLADSLSQQGRKWAEDFSWSRICDRILSLYERALTIPAVGGKEIHA